jgi:hypothetical protein
MLNRIQCATKNVISAAHADLQAGVVQVHYRYYMRAYHAIDAYAVEDEEAESMDAEPSEQGTWRSAAKTVARLKRGEGMRLETKYEREENRIDTVLEMKTEDEQCDVGA